MKLSAFLVSDPSILHASGFMTYCLACLCLHACVCECVSGGSLTASCSLNIPRESLASQDREDTEKTSFHANASMLTRAVCTQLFVCVKEGMDLCVCVCVCVCACVCVCVCVGEADGMQYSGGRAEVTRRAFTFH